MGFCVRHEFARQGNDTRNHNLLGGETVFFDPRNIENLILWLDLQIVWQLIISCDYRNGVNFQKSKVCEIQNDKFLLGKASESDRFEGMT